MWIEAVVIDASPLITLFRSEQADLLPRLFNRIVVPEAVWQEVVDERDDAAALGLTRQAWPIREKVPISPREKSGSVPNLLSSSSIAAHIYSAPI